MAGPKAYQRRRPGGEHPELGALVRETVDDLQDHLGEHLLAGVAPFGLTLVVVIAALLVGQVLATVGLLGGMVAAIGVWLAAEQAVGSDGAGLLLLPVQLTWVSALFLGAGGFGAVIGGALAPVQASLSRAVAAHQRGESKLGPEAAFSTIGVRPLGAVVAGTLLGGLAVLGLFLCSLPALAVPIALGFGPTLVALHPVGGLRALALSARHALAHPSWAVPFGLAAAVLLVVSNQVPVLGPMFALSLQVRAHRYVFGDGEEPVLSADGSSSGDRNTQ